MMKRLIIEGKRCYEICRGEPNPIDAGCQLYYRDIRGDVRRYPSTELIQLSEIVDGETAEAAGGE